MQSRAILFLILSLTILYLYSLYEYRQEKERLEAIEALPPAQEAGPAEQAPAPPVPGDDLPAGEPLAAGDEVLEAEARQVTVETMLFTAVLTTRGGVLQHWELKQYREKVAPDSPPIVLFDARQIQPEISPLGVWVEGEDPAVQGRFREGPYRLEGRDLVLKTPGEQGSLEFVARDPAGRVLTKRLTFFADRYAMDVRIEASGFKDGYTLYVGTNFGILDWGKKTFVSFVGPTSLIDQEVVRDAPAKMEAEVAHEGALTWTALQDKYFVASLIPLDGQGRAVARKLGEDRVTVGVRHVSQDARQANSFRLYAGPKEYDRLRAYRLHLEEMIDFGWFLYGSWAMVRLIAQPLFSVLRLFHDFTHNYGLAIILLTTIIKILFAPLTHKSYVSMKAMQKVQPHVAELQKKFKNDKQRLQQELMGLYKKHKVNPLGGCLPMVLQIPVFIALFNILYTTIELRHAPFMLWIRDLSDKDPYYVLPIIMGASMLLQQKLQPAAIDPRQAKIMMFLPIIFTYFFLFFPSGLVLYWVVNNTLSILQQYITNRYLGKSQEVAKAVAKAS